MTATKRDIEDGAHDVTLMVGRGRHDKRTERTVKAVIWCSCQKATACVTIYEMMCTDIKEADCSRRNVK